MNTTALQFQTSLAQEPRRKATPFLLFTGGKGGVGKTTLTADLGLLLARQGRRVLLVDLDLGLANLDVVLRLRSDRNVEDALAGKCAFEDCVIRGPSGVYLLPAGSGSAEMGRPDSERRALAQAAGADLRLVVVDASVPLGAEGIELVRRITVLGAVLVVLNKTDLPPVTSSAQLVTATGQRVVGVSALQGAGMAELARASLDVLGLTEVVGGGVCPVTAEQAELLNRVADGLAIGRVGACDELAQLVDSTDR